MRYRLKKILFKIEIIINKIYCYINKNNMENSIAIISCDRWKNRVKEDFLLKRALNKSHINADIISWQDKRIDYKKYKKIIIRSIWGYQDFIDEFYSWLDKINENDLVICNDISILKQNLDKEIQFNILDKYSIPHVKTDFIRGTDVVEKIKNIVGRDEYVIKPIVSGSGKNTYLLNSNKKNSISISEIQDRFFDILSNKNNGLMVQPFMKEIDNGEYSIIFVNNRLLYAVRRLTSIFNDKYMVEYIDKCDLDSKLIKFCESILKIEEYKNYFYMRIDVIKSQNNYLVMELELVDPDLFLCSVDKKHRNEYLDYIVEQIKK